MVANLATYLRPKAVADKHKVVGRLLVQSHEIANKSGDHGRHNLCVAHRVHVIGHHRANRPVDYDHVVVSTLLTIQDGILDSLFG